jgi:RNA polymerase primary sigma factor
MLEEQLINKFMQEAKDKGRLTSKETSDMFKAIDVVLDTFPKDREWTNKELLKEGSEAALSIVGMRNKIFNHNILLAIKYARKARSTRVSELDLIQEAQIGLMRAIELFEQKRGLQLSTFATFWIRAHVGRFVNTNYFIAHVPIHVIEKMKKEKKEAKENRLQKILLGASQEHCIDDFKSLEDEDNTLTAIEKEKDVEIVNKHLNVALDTFPERTKKIIELRFGLNGNRAHTLEEVGEIIGVTRERIRQVEASALTELYKKVHTLQEFLTYE